MLKNARIIVKVYLVFAVPMILFFAMGAAFFVSSEAIKQKVHHTKDESSEFADKARRLQLSATQVQQFLTDVSATRGLNGLNSGYEEAKLAAETFQKELRDFKEMFKRENDAEALAKIEALEKAFEQYYATGKTMADEYVSKGPDAGNALMPVFDEAAESLRQQLLPFVESQLSELNASMTDVLAKLTQMTLLVALLFLIGLLGGGFVAALIVRTLRGPLESLEAASRLAASLEEISSSMTELTSQTKLNAESALQAKDLAQEATVSAFAGKEKLAKTLEAIKEMNVASGKIASILKAIEDIAFQTNLLALNASVEAARAGKHGKGFGVVAEEVRNLAERSAKSAKETAELVDNARTKADTGLVVASETAKVFEDIVRGIESLTQLVGGIAAATQHQATGIREVSLGIGQIDQVTQQNTAAAEQSAAAAEQLSSQAQVLQSLVASFKTHA